MSFNSRLILKAFGEEFDTTKEIPEKLIIGETHIFVEKGQNNYWLKGYVRLCELNEEEVSSPLASIKILETTHFISDGEVCTRGKYKIKEVYSKR